MLCAGNPGGYHCRSLPDLRGLPLSPILGEFRDNWQTLAFSWEVLVSWHIPTPKNGYLKNSSDTTYPKQSGKQYTRKNKFLISPYLLMDKQKWKREKKTSKKADIWRKIIRNKIIPFKLISKREKSENSHNMLCQLQKTYPTTKCLPAGNSVE